MVRSEFGVKGFETAETHGMAQRGGSVICYIGIGNVHGPLVPKGMANAVLAFEETEALRYIDYANNETVFQSKNSEYSPGLIFVKGKTYPTEEEIVESLRKISPHIYLIDARQIAEEVGEPKAENVVILAYLLASGCFPIEKEIFLDSILNFVPERLEMPIVRAFELAYNAPKKNIRIAECQD